MQIRYVEIRLTEKQANAVSSTLHDWGYGTGLRAMRIIDSELQALWMEDQRRIDELTSD